MKLHLDDPFKIDNPRQCGLGRARPLAVLASSEWGKAHAAMGDVLLDAMTRRPDRRLTVLCGHTHSPGRADLLPNLVVLTGEAVYGRPRVQATLDVR